MSSTVEICNMALARIGHSERIASLEEKSKAARVCKLFFDQVRDYVLRDCDWPFATAYKVLADLGSPPLNWQFRYQYPNDCLKARYINVPGIRLMGEEQMITYQIAAGSNGRVILTDMPQAELVYTLAITDPLLFDPMFVSALAWRLASEIAMPLAVEPGYASGALQAYQFEVGQAYAAALNESQKDPDIASEFIRARG